MVFENTIKMGSEANNGNHIFILQRISNTSSANPKNNIENKDSKAERNCPNCRKQNIFIIVKTVLKNHLVVRESRYSSGGFANVIDVEPR